MKKLLLVLDLQKSYWNREIEQLKNKIEEYMEHAYYDEVILGKFINKTDGIFVKRGNMDCLDVEDQKLLIKPKEIVMEHYGYTMATEELEEYLKENKIKYIYLCGMNTECSIYKTALDLLERGYYVYVVKDLCASKNGKKYHDMGISLLEKAIGREYVI